jgi:hypothetical protein
MMSLEEAKERLRIPDLWRQFNLQGQPRTSCKSPFREDRRPSFSVSRDGLLFNDFATGQGGDAIHFLQLATGLEPKAACRRFIELASGEVKLSRTQATRSAKVSAPRQRPEFPDFQKGSAADFERLGLLRNLSTEGLQLASERGLLWFAELRGFDAWIITDSERLNAQARRMDGDTWEHLEGKPKAWTLQGSFARWPIGAKESRRFESIAFCEGGPDLCAAHHFIWCEGREREVTAVAMLGATQRIHDFALPLLAGKRIRIFPHHDASGENALQLWTRQLQSVGADVDYFDLSGLLTQSRARVSDLNDLCSIEYDEFKSDRQLWHIMP